MEPPRPSRPRSIRLNCWDADVANRLGNTDSVHIHSDGRCTRCTATEGKGIFFVLSILPLAAGRWRRTGDEGPRLACRSRSTLAHQHPPVLILAAHAGNGQMGGTSDTFAYATSTVLHRVSAAGSGAGAPHCASVLSTDFGVNLSGSAAGKDDIVLRSVLRSLAIYLHPSISS
jgi:hypothetical protein